MPQKKTKAARKRGHSMERRKDLRDKGASTLTATGIENATEIIFQDAASIGDLSHMNAAIGRRLQLESLKIRMGAYRRIPLGKQLFLG